MYQYDSKSTKHIYKVFYALTSMLYTLDTHLVLVIWQWGMHFAMLPGIAWIFEVKYTMFPVPRPL